jgi:hypothetical protein
MNADVHITQDTSTVFINQLPTSHAFKKVYVMLGSKSLITYDLLLNAV